MPPPPQQKPENILKRAHELVAVDKTQAALELLHEHVTSKRTRSAPIASLEPVMLLFVELCVDLRKGKYAKEGLYQYKNIAQNTSVQTIELVLKKFIELAESKVTEAQAKAEAINVENVDDLEASETPESILLSSVSGEQSKDRTDRAVVTPWLKFLWETYRTVLDILRNNARLEIMYQQTALQAFDFCLKYARKTEFRRLCELLRNHVQNAAKYSTQMHAINLNDPDTLQRHLDTRFQQLNVAVELELWQEAFRSVEDIHTLLNLSKRPPKAVMMANYYEKLTRIFLVSENFLFHAAAWNRYYNLLRSSAAQVAASAMPKKDAPSVSESDVQRAASFVVLSALAIPVISTSRSRGFLLDIDEAKRNKNTRLTNLLGMGKAPTRQGLFKEIIGRGLLQRARPEIRELYTILEVDFHPLSICRKISPILSKIAADEEMKKYVAPLHQVILTRLFQQLSQVYESVSLDFVIQLASFPPPFDVSAATIEKFIMNGCKKGELSIRIDHSAGVLTFESDVFSAAKALHPGQSSNEKGVQKLQSTPSETVRSQLSRLGKALYLTCSYVDPSFTQARQEAKAAAFARAEAGAEQEHKDVLSRRTIIEKRKETAETVLIQKERAEAEMRQKKQQELQAAESKRLAEQLKARELARVKAEQDRIRMEELMKQVEEIKASGTLDLDLSNLSELDSSTLRAMKLQQLEREKKDLNDKLRITGKRIDHLERAYRREEVKILGQDYEKQKAEDRAAYEERVRVQEETAKAKHEEAVALKKRLERLVPVYEKFRDEIKSKRHDEFEQRRKSAEKQLKVEMEKRKKQVRDAIAAKKAREEEEERRRVEEEERIRKEEEEKARAEEEKREALAKLKAQREEERRVLDEKARIQRQREEEVEARLKKEREESQRGSAAPAAADGVARWRPRAREPTADASPSNGDAAPAPSSEGKYRPPVRDRPSADSTPPAEDKPTTGRYVPGAFRKTKLGTDDSTPPAPERREIPRREFVRNDSERSGSGDRAPPPRREFVRGEPDRADSGERASRAEATDGKSPAPSTGGKYVPPSQRTGGWGRK